MKTVISVLLLVITLHTQAQKATSGLLFCTGVDEKFQPLNAGKEMSLKNNEVTLLYYYWNEPFIGTDHLTYKTFTIDKKGKETLSATIQQTIQPGWRMVKQSARFTHAGTYRVKVYNKDNLELAAATLTIK